MLKGKILSYDVIQSWPTPVRRNAYHVAHIKYEPHPSEIGKTVRVETTHIGSPYRRFISAAMCKPSGLKMQTVEVYDARVQDSNKSTFDMPIDALNQMIEHAHTNWTPMAISEAPVIAWFEVVSGGETVAHQFLLVRHAPSLDGYSFPDADTTWLEPGRLLNMLSRSPT